MHHTEVCVCLTGHVTLTRFLHDWLRFCVSRPFDITITPRAQTKTLVPSVVHASGTPQTLTRSSSGYLSKRRRGRS